MNDLITSVIRTTTPTLVGALGAFLASKGINIDQEALSGLTAFLTALISVVYYSLVRLAEIRYPKAGYLLGSQKQPKY